MPFWNYVRSIGPAIIVASIVLGPGSILTSSKVGCQFGYSMLWVVALAVLLMMGATALACHLGVYCKRSLCDEVAHRTHRAVAVAVGVIVFLIVACFQSSNNMAVLASIEGLLEAPGGAESAIDAQRGAVPLKIGALALINGAIIATLFGLHSLYRPLELFMIVLVLIMLTAFTFNLAFAQPSLREVGAGLLPRFASLSSGAESARLTVSIWSLFGLVATTFSIAGAFYQGYLVREKGWSPADMKRGLIDVVVGIALLGFVSAVIMVTSAAALHGNVDHTQLKSVADIAQQLTPAFGRAATWIFSFGIFAAAFSSFLGNALVGGTILADGLGLGSSIDAVWPRRLTVAALLIGMLVASIAAIADAPPVTVIVFAQALTVLGGPALAVILLWLGFRFRQKGIPAWILAVAGCGVAAQLMLAGRTLSGLIE